MGIKLGKSYANVYDLLRGEYPDHPEFAESFLETYKREQIAFTLFMMRTKLGITQDELAKRMGVSQSKIAKLEDRGDNVKFNDVIAYARALDHNVSLQLSQEELKLSSMLRWHFDAIAGIMAKMQDLAKDSPNISADVFQRFAEESNRMFNAVYPKCVSLLDEAEKQKAAFKTPESRGVHVEILSNNLSSAVG